MKYSANGSEELCLTVMKSLPHDESSMTATELSAISMFFIIIFRF